MIYVAEGAFVHILHRFVPVSKPLQKSSESTFRKKLYADDLMQM